MPRSSSVMATRSSCAAKSILGCTDNLTQLKICILGCFSHTVFVFAAIKRCFCLGPPQITLALRQWISDGRVSLNQTVSVASALSGQFRGITMKKTLAVAVVAAIAGVAGAANAADMYAPGGYKDVPVAVAPTWTGFYIGANVGGVWADIADDNGTTTTMSTRSMLNWNDYSMEQQSRPASSAAARLATTGRSSAFVFGVEADFGGTGLSHTGHNGMLVRKMAIYSSKNDGGFMLTLRAARVMLRACSVLRQGWLGLLRRTISPSGRLRHSLRRRRTQRTGTDQLPERA